MIYTSREVYEYISRQTNDPIIEWKTCAISGTQFPIYQSDLDFYTKISRGLPGYQESPLSGGEGLGVRIPTPTLCPEERQRRRLSFRNERKLYKRTCDATGDRIISIYSPDKPYKVYDQKFRRSDHRDPMDYGRDFDFSKTFTEQFRELMREVPLLGLMNMENEYSEYTNYTGRSKNCYLCNDVMYSDMLMYSNIIKNCSNSLELSDNKESIECYQLLRSENCRKCYFGVFLENCNNCYFSYNLNNCKNCIYSANLNNKEYYIYNKSVSKDDFIEMLNTIQTDINKDAYSQYLNFIQKSIRSSTRNIGSYNIFGNLLHNSKNCILYFDSYNNDGCKYGFNGDSNHNCFDVCICNPNCNLSYEMISGGEQYKCGYNIACAFLQNGYYSTLCFNSSHLFGCIGLRNKSYCIFNKQYTKEEYEELVPKIIRHMQSTGERGEFFHPSLSPFGYNETVAQEYFPLQSITDSSEGLELTDPLNNSVNFGTFGYHRSTYSSDPIIPEGVKAIDCRGTEWAPESEGWKQLNETTLDPSATNYDICKQIIVCEVSGRPFMLQKAEIDFYRKHHIPLPRKHPDIRHEERMKLRPGRTLFLRNCDCCGKEMLSVYPQDHEGKVYCEECYQKEVYG